MKKSGFADLHGLVRLEVAHERSQFDNRCRNKHVDRRVAEGDRPQARIGGGWPTSDC